MTMAPKPSSSSSSAMNDAPNNDDISLEQVGVGAAPEDNARERKSQKNSLHDDDNDSFNDNDNTTTTEEEEDNNTPSSVDTSREMFQQRFGKPTRQAMHDFFYKRRQQAQPDTPPSPETSVEDDIVWVEGFWKTYDDIIFISILTQIGMVFRLAAAKWFSVFDKTFRADSALFIQLPLNCLACWVLGFLGDGPSLMSIVETRFTPQDLQQALQEEEEHGMVWNGPISPRQGNDAPLNEDGIARRRRRSQRQASTQWTRPRRVGNVQLRQVQLLAWNEEFEQVPVSSCFQSRNKMWMSWIIMFPLAIIRLEHRRLFRMKMSRMVVHH